METPNVDFVLEIERNDTVSIEVVSQAEERQPFRVVPARLRTQQVLRQAFCTHLFIQTHSSGQGGSSGGGSCNVFLAYVSPPSIGHVHTASTASLLLCPTCEESPDPLPSVFRQRMYPHCRTGLPVDTCNSTLFRSSCTVAHVSSSVFTYDDSTEVSPLQLTCLHLQTP